MSIKISFMHFMKWARLMLPVVFKEFGLVCIFLLFFFYSLSLSISRRSTLAKILGGAAAPPATHCFCGPAVVRGLLFP